MAFVPQNSAGLELAPTVNYDSGLEVDDRYTSYPEVVHPEGAPIKLPGSYSEVSQKPKEDQYPNEHVPVQPERKIFGLSRKLFFILAAVLVVVIIGAVGGGVGDALAGKNKNNDSNTATPTSSTPPSSTSSIPSTSPTVAVDAAGCPTSNGTTYTSTKDHKTSFIRLCETDLNPKSGDPSQFDLTHELVPTLEDCMDLCATWNANATNTKKCLAASWDIFVHSIPTQNEVCFLKSSLNVKHTNTTIQGGNVASAILISNS